MKLKIFLRYSFFPTWSGQGLISTPVLWLIIIMHGRKRQLYVPGQKKSSEVSLGCFDNSKTFTVLKHSHHFFSCWLPLGNYIDTFCFYRLFNLLQNYIFVVEYSNF